MIGKHKIQKIVLCEGNIETLGYFSNQLAKTFREEGFEVFVFNFQDEVKSMIGLANFILPGKTALVTFNYTGLIGETCFDVPNGSTIWNEADIDCINIVVDHPFYYHKFYPMLPNHYFQYCIDRSHLAYMKRFFPEINVDFLPLAGTSLTSKLIPYKDRSMDVVFTGNYTPPETFNKDITRIDDEYTAFYYRIIHELIEHTEFTMEEAIEKHVRIDIPDVTELDLKGVMPNMIFLDLYVRFYFRGLVVKTIVDSGIPVHVFGSGWHNLSVEKPENLIIMGSRDSKGCLDAIANSKISLNVMPWFKDGAHDRIYNSMANGAVCISDDSIYLKDTLSDHKNLIFYHLKETQVLPELISNLLCDTKSAEMIAKNAYEYVMKNDTWKQRAQYIIEHNL